MSDRTTLAKSNREDRETFYLPTMDASLSRIVRMGDEMTKEEVRVRLCGIGPKGLIDGNWSSVRGRDDRRSRLANRLDARLSNCWIILR
jgi:hypothetical protein